MTSPRIYIHARSPRLREAAHLLATTLRRPLLHVLDDASQAGDGPTILLDPTESDRVGYPRSRACYRVESGTPGKSPVECRLAGGIQVRLPESLECLREDNGYLAEPTAMNRARSMLAIAWRRIRKSSDRGTGDDLFESALCSAMFGRVFGDSAREDFEAWFRIDEKASVLKHSTLACGGVDSLPARLEHLVRECLERADSERHFRHLASATAGEEPLDDVAMARIMARPSVLAHASLSIMESGAGAEADRLALGMESWLPQSRNAKQMCAIGFAALVMRDEGLLAAVVRRMDESTWRIKDSALLPLVPGKRNIERSLLAAGLVAALAMRSEGVGFSSLSSMQDRAELEWSGFGSQLIDGSVEGASLRFFDPAERRISASLLENWLRMIEQPDINHGQLCISDSRYQQGVVALEAMWGRIIDAIAVEAGQPVVRVRPWPQGSDFAISVRYDVDRPVPEGQVDRILRIQSESIGGMCGSWFFLQEASHNESVRQAIRGHQQEEGVHSTRLSRESCEGMGVTAHSSQYSEYFTGRRSLVEAEKGRALYTEQMNHLAVAPRPAWLGDRMTDTWAFPLHFPVEGSVGDVDLAYFERYAEVCIDQRTVGAHVVIGAHPDCRPELVGDAIKRCGLGGGGGAPPNGGHRTVRAINTPGNIRIQIQDGQVMAWSRSYVENVVFEFIPPGRGCSLLRANLKADKVVPLLPLGE